MNKSWSEAVVEACRADEERSELFAEACKINAEDNGPTPSDASALLEWLRGDEPVDAEEGGDTAQDYADFLLTEYDLYGPEGE